MNPEEPIMEEPVKKKRGRKKKSEVANTEQAPETTDVPTTEEKPKAKRGRKTKTVTNSYTTDQSASCMSDDENVIVKLNIPADSAAHQNVPATENNEDVNAYVQQSSFESKPLDFSVKDVESDAQNEETAKRDKNVIELLTDFKMKNKMKEWPQSTSNACYWCCHKFTTTPFGIPVKYTHNKFHVSGCFCSLECACAYNFDSHESLDEKWERYNLINLLSRKLCYKTIVKPAPCRLSLKMFGGHLDIEEFRSMFDSNKILMVNFPPMMTLTQQIEEVNEADVQGEYRYIPIDHERISKYKEKLTLKRSKPVTNYKHTLDHMMNLKIN